MSAQLEVDPSGDAEGELLLIGLLFAVLVGGVLLGGLSVWVGCRCCAPRPSSRGPPPESWARIVTKALRFIRRRRRIALAWGNYRNHPLRQLPTTSSRRSSGRQESGSSEELRPLQEGPAIGDGAHRRRTERNRHARGGL